MNKSRKSRNDIILVAVILLIAAAGLLLVSLNREAGAFATVKIDGMETASYPLSEDITVEITSGENGEFSNTLVIEKGKAYISQADCPDKICAGHRAVSYTGETIVCLPHKVIVEITSGTDTDGLDIIA